MLLSMTGFGDARLQTESLNVAVEVRAVNHRYLKVNVKVPDGYTRLEPKIEQMVRDSLSRGTVTVAMRIDWTDVGSPYRLNTELIEGYWRDLRRLSERLHIAVPTDLGAFLQLPGVASEQGVEVDEESDWSVVRPALASALEKLQEFRRVEGASMEGDLRAQCRILREHLDAVGAAAPQVVRDYRDRLHERVQELLEGTDTPISGDDLLRDVSIFAERCDINEEVTRLRSHLEQFETFVQDEASLGRKMEFLVQEMHREVNTVGSKANDSEIAHHVVEMKAAVEKLREILQNVE